MEKEREDLEEESGGSINVQHITAHRFTYESCKFILSEHAKLMNKST